MMSMSGYTKLFNSILASTIWREPNHVRIVWITLLAMADKHGVAEGSIPGLADFARVSLEDCADALRRLQEPDEFSRSQDFEGRRIMPIDGGWQILNHAKYREKMTDDERREYLRIKQAEYRAKKKAAVSDVSTGVANVSDKYTELTQAEAEAEADTDSEAEQKKQQNVTTAAPLIRSSLDVHKAQQRCAYVGARLDVPNHLHTELVRTTGGDDPQGRLLAWYAELDTELERTREVIAPDVFKWLKAKWKAWMAPQVKTADRAAWEAKMKAAAARVTK